MAMIFGLLSLVTLMASAADESTNDDASPAVVQWQTHATLPVSPLGNSARLVAGEAERLWVAEPQGDALWAWDADSSQWELTPFPEGSHWTGSPGTVVNGVLWVPVRDVAGLVSLWTPGNESDPQPLNEASTAVSLGQWKARLVALTTGPNGENRLLIQHEDPSSDQAWQSHAGPPEKVADGHWLLVAQRYEEKLVLFAWGSSTEAPGVFTGWRWDAKAKVWKEVDRVAGLHPQRAAPIGVGHILFLPSADNINSPETPQLYGTFIESWTHFPIIEAIRGAQDILVNTSSEGGMPRIFLLDADGTPAILQSEAGIRNARLPTIDYVFLFGYLLLMVGLGWWFARRQKEGKDFFLGGNRVPGWAAGLSILASKISAVSFLSVPAKAFAANWIFFPFQIASLLIVPFAVRFLVPFIRRIQIVSIFEYLERRFHLGLRLYGTIINLFQAIFGLGVYIYLPSIILSLITGIPVFACIVIIGMTAVIYTFLGGIEAVIWTDVLQVLVIMLGLGASIFMILFKGDFSLPEVATQAYAMGKLKTFEWDFGLTEATVLVWFFVLMDRPTQYLSHQSVVQRISSTPSLEQAKRSAWTSLLAGVPVVICFYIMGTLLFFFYSGRPEALSPTMEHPDQLFPFFIIAELPWGITGIVIGAIFAATMSTLDTGLGGMATILTRDFYTRLYPKATDVGALRVARIITIIMGLIGIGSAIMYSTLPIKSLFDRLFEVIAFFSGLTGGMFVLGVISRRAHTRGVLVGSVLAAVIQLTLKLNTPLNFLMFGFTGLFLNISLGYLFSLIIPPGKVSPEAESLQLWSYRSSGHNEPQVPDSR